MDLEEKDHAKRASNFHFRFQLPFTKIISASLFIDVDEPYDNVNLQILSQKMVERGIPKVLIKKCFQNVQHSKFIYQDK